MLSLYASIHQETDDVKSDEQTPHVMDKYKKAYRKKTSSDKLEELFVQTDLLAGKEYIGANGSGFNFCSPNNQDLTFY